MRQLIDAGIHFGHRVSRWNPKMEPYIFGRRNLIHIIDIKETVKGLLRARKFVSRLAGEGQDVLFVGTKRQARQAVVEHARRVGMHYVADRWLGGTLTNFRTIRSRLSRLEELEAMESGGLLEQYSKKMVATLQREKRKISRNLQGIRNMSRLPGALVIVDVRREHIAAREAKKLRIPTVCLIDTDSDPDYADIPIPGNDDGMRAIELIVQGLADAIEEGKKGRTAEQGEELPGRQPRRRSRRATARADERGKPEETAARVGKQSASPDESLVAGGEAPPVELAETEAPSSNPAEAFESSLQDDQGQPLPPDVPREREGRGEAS